MKFRFNDFEVVTEKKIEKLNEQIAVPNSIKNDKPINYKWEYKTREMTVFKTLSFIDKEVINDLFDFIKLIEMLKAFSSNKLDTSKEYNINNKFEAKTAQKDKNITLKIHFANSSNSLYLDKFECNALASCFSKILNRCEAWQEQQA